MDEGKRRHILGAALGVFWKHGFRRVNMTEIAEAAGISRPGLYLYFKTKDEVFTGALKHYADGLFEAIDRGIARKTAPNEKLLFVFEIWAVRGFAEFLKSPEVRELSECSLEFARDAFDESYGKLANVIVSVLKEHARADSTRKMPPPDRTARVLIGAVRGFKQVATSPAELRTMIRDLIKITLGAG